jgi:hypothetical protein
MTPPAARGETTDGRAARREGHGMSRMFTALSGPGRAAESEPVEDVPFVEVGGPDGLVFSTPKSTPKVEVAAPREFPRLAPEPRYLSVTFHDATTKARLAPPAEGPDAELVALHYPDHPVSAEYRVLRDEIRGQHADAGTKVLLFTAAAPEAGTTTVLLNLAVTLAARRRRGCWWWTRT